MVKECFEKIFLWPLFGGVTAIFGVIAGYLGAHYDEEIASTFAPWFFEGRSLSIGASLFWVTLTLFGASFTGTFWAQARSSARVSTEMAEVTERIDNKTDSLTKSATELNNMILQLHTLPPKGFLETYRKVVVNSEAAYEEARSQILDFEQLALIIRTQLLWILRLVQAFDADGEKAKYGLSIMLYRENKPFLPCELESLTKRLRFYEEGLSVGKLAGVLDMVCEFSVSSSNSNANRDPNLTPFALPIPELNEEERNARSKNGVLPGAPDAFISGAESVIETPNDWIDQANTNQFSEPLRQQLTDFFTEASSWMKSFVSIPLFEPDCPESSTPIAILNIHRNLPNKLAAEKYELLSPLLVPVTLTIGRLIWSNRDNLPNIAITGEHQNEN